MIEILHEYWKPLLWTDGYRFTGVAITLWLLILSVVIGGVMALFLAIGRVSSNKYIQFPIWLFTYIFRGTPLYVQLLVFYSGMYTLEIVKGTEFLNAFFSQWPELYRAGADAQHLRLHYRDFCRSDPFSAAWGNRSRQSLWLLDL